MDTKFETTYHELEASHFWFRCRRELICKMLATSPKSSKILDVGCSTGILLEMLENKGFDSSNLFGIDISEAAIKHSKERGLHNTSVMDAEDFEIAEQFDVIIASDCLEHLDREELALQTWVRHLKPNGKLIVFVPAFQSLWSQHDVVNHHKRRYIKGKLTQLLQEELTVQYSGYWNSFLFPLIWFFRKIQKLFSLKSNPEKGDLAKLPRFNPLLYQILKIEESWVGKFSLPFGVSAYSIGIKEL